MKMETGSKKKNQPTDAIKSRIRLSRHLEAIWLFAGIAGAVTSVYDTWKSGFENAYLLYLVTLASFMIYFFRKRYRNKLKKKLEGVYTKGNQVSEKKQ